MYYIRLKTLIVFTSVIITGVFIIHIFLILLKIYN